MSNITFYGAEWCSDCRRAKSFLEQNSIEFNYINMETVEGAAKTIMELNNGKRIIPTIIINNKPYSNPNNQDLKSILSL